MWVLTGSSDNCCRGASNCCVYEWYHTDISGNCCKGYLFSPLHLAPTSVFSSPYYRKSSTAACPSRPSAPFRSCNQETKHQLPSAEVTWHQKESHNTWCTEKAQKRKWSQPILSCCVAIQLACIMLICCVATLAHHFVEIKGTETWAG